MFDLLQAMSRGQIVETADGKKWLTLYLVGSTKTHTTYLACESDATCPADVKLIAVTREWEDENARRTDRKESP